MVKLTKIYTRGGDKGKTSLGSGKRVPKHDLRVAAYGTVDEANAILGMARLHCDGAADELLARLQNELFDLGADLCTPEVEDPPYPPLRITPAQVTRLEQEIDRINQNLEPLTSFILPGGAAAAAYLHLARTVARRAEREMTALSDSETVNPAALRYVNRLSDLLFRPGAAAERRRQIRCALGAGQHQVGPRPVRPQARPCRPDRRPARERSETPWQQGQLQRRWTGRIDPGNLLIRLWNSHIFSAGESLAAVIDRPPPSNYCARAKSWG